MEHWNLSILFILCLFQFTVKYKILKITSTWNRNLALSNYNKSKIIWLNLPLWTKGSIYTFLFFFWFSSPIIPHTAFLFHPVSIHGLLPSYTDYCQHPWPVWSTIFKGLPKRKAITCPLGNHLAGDNVWISSPPNGIYAACASMSLAILKTHPSEFLVERMLMSSSTSGKLGLFWNSWKLCIALIASDFLRYKFFLR